MIPDGLTRAQQLVWRGALIVQGGDPTRPVSFAEIGRAVQIHRVSVRSTVRRIKQSGILWPFPEHQGGHPPGLRCPSRPGFSGRRALPRSDDSPQKKRRERLERLKAGYANVRIYRSVRLYVIEWKLFSRRAMR